MPKKIKERRKEINPPELRKGQKCWLCKKEIKKGWAYNGHYWHQRCKDKDSTKRIKNYLKND